MPWHLDLWDERTDESYERDQERKRQEEESRKAAEEGTTAVARMKTGFRRILFGG